MIISKRNEQETAMLKWTEYKEIFTHREDTMWPEDKFQRFHEHYRWTLCPVIAPATLGQY